MLDQVDFELEAGVVGSQVDAHGARGCHTEPVAGVDGVRDRWLVATVTAGRVAWTVAEDAAAVLRATGECAAVGVDVPMGLPETGYRSCDLAARARLGRDRSSVFHAPIRRVLRAATHPTASAASRAAHGKGISIQVWGLLPKIEQWDDLAVPEHVVEVHPEVSFRAMAPATVFAGKKTARGAVQRLRAVSAWLPAGSLLAGLPADAPLEDALDALACAWSATRYARNGTDTLGGERDEHGQPMRIVV